MSLPDQASPVGPTTAQDYQTLLESVAQTVWETDAAGRVVTDSPSWRAYTGQTSAQWLSEGWTGAVHPHERDDALRQWQQAVRQQTPLNAEFRLQSHDGGWRWTNVRAVASRSAEGSVMKWLGLTIDATERKKNEEALRESEEKFRSLFQTMREGFAVSQLIRDPNGKPIDYRFLMLNSAYEKLAGLSPESSIGRTAREMYPDWGVDIYAGVVDSGEPLRFENYSQGLGRWYSVLAFPLGGDRYGILYDDITERRQQEERQSFLLRLSDALRPLTDAIAIQETAARVLGEQLGVDRAYYARLDWERGLAVIERDFFRGEVPSVVGEHQLASFAGSEQAYRDGVLVLDDVENAHALPPSDLLAYRALSVRSVLSVVLVKQGVWVASMTLLKAVPHHWTQPEISLLEATAERTWAFVERARAEEALRLEDRRKDEFMSMLGHELRNPLASLSNLLLVLKLTRGEDESLSYPQAVEIMSRETDHMSRMADDLLDVGRVRYGLINLHKEHVDLLAIVRHTVEVARPLYQEQHRQLSLTLPPYSLSMMGDGTRLSQVLMNLLTNGLKYTQPGGHVWVSLALADNTIASKQVLLMVKDDGIGIALDQQEAIFDIFVQGKTTLDRPQGGLGLGLAVVKQLVGLHEGRIEVHSEGPGQGSEFLIYLPLALDVPTSESAARLLPHPAQSEGRVLVVDDNQTLADMTARLVELSGYQSRASYSGADALLVAQQWRPDVVLLDLGMPYMDGFEVSRRLSEQPWGETMSIVALTGYGQPSLKERTAQAGFADYLLKPLSLPRLRELLTRIMTQRTFGS